MKYGSVNSTYVLSQFREIFKNCREHRRIEISRQLSDGWRVEAQDGTEVRVVAVLMWFSDGKRFYCWKRALHPNYGVESSANGKADWCMMKFNEVSQIWSCYWQKWKRWATSGILDVWNTASVGNDKVLMLLSTWVKR